MNEAPHLASETLSAFLDGRLAARERAAAEAHLASCTTCRSLLDSYAEGDRELARWADAAHTVRSEAEWEALAARIDRAIRAEEKEPSWWRVLGRAFTRPALAWGAAGTFAAAVLVILLRPHTPSIAPDEARIASPAAELDTRSTAPPTAPLPTPPAPRSNEAPPHDVRGVRPEAGTFASGELSKKAPAPVAKAPAEVEIEIPAPGTSPKVESPIARMKSDRAPSSPSARIDVMSESGEAAMSLAPLVDSLAILDAATDDSTRLGREVAIVARLVAADPRAHCIDARERLPRWRANPAFGALPPATRQLVEDIAKTCAD